MKIIRGIIGAVVFGIIGQLSVWLFYGMIFMSWTEKYQHLWRPMDDPIWIVGMPAAEILTGLIFALVYAILYKGLPGTGIKKGMSLGLIIWAFSRFAGEIFFYVMSPVSFMMVIIGWLQGIVALLLGGLAIAAIFGKTLEQTEVA